MEQIQLTGIRKSYGIETAVQNLDLTVNSGDFLTILVHLVAEKPQLFVPLPDWRNQTKGKSSSVKESFFQENKVLSFHLKIET